MYFNPTPEDYRAAFLVDADVINQSAPQFFPELRLFSRQIFQLDDEVHEYLLRVILLLDECLQFPEIGYAFHHTGCVASLLSLPAPSDSKQHWHSSG